MKIIKNIIGAFDVPKVIKAIKGNDTSVKSKAISKLAVGTPSLMGLGVTLIYEGIEYEDNMVFITGAIFVLVSVVLVERMGDKISKIDSDADNK